VVTVSVIIPSFQCAGLIGRALESLNAQTRPVDEIIVVDDGSSDNTGEMVPASVRYLRHEVNRGVSAARNTGAREATGDYVMFLDADDTLVPDAIAKLLAATEAAGAVWCYSDVCRVEPDGEIIPVPCGSHGPDPLADILEDDFIMSGAFFRRAEFLEVGMYDENLKAREDWDIDIRMIEAGKRFAYVSEPIYRYHRRMDSITNAPGLTTLVATLRVFDKHHRRLAPHHRRFAFAYGAALWRLGASYWERRDVLPALRYSAESIVRQRSFRNLTRVLTR